MIVEGFGDLQMAYVSKISVTWVMAEREWG